MSEEATKWLRIYNIAREFRTLPHSGGVVDQPDGTIRRLETIIRVFRDKEADEERKSEAKARLEKRLA